MEKTFVSPAAQILISVTPIVGIVIGGVVIFFYLLWRHREISLQIKTGTYRENGFKLRLFALLTGLLLMGVGFVLTVVIILVSGVSYTLLGGLIPSGLGIGLLVFYRLRPEGRAERASDAIGGQ
ncbi:MAG: hypothetical protein LBS64_05820 [Spirochaetaceae bacterium]|jgi:hypothetical protein|nr:hypothetical protein [Spirochaetaceae bacterium]